MQRFNPDKTISANANGIIISYQDANKHQYIGYDSHVKQIQESGTVRYQTIEESTPSSSFQFSPKQKELFARVMYGFKAYTREETVKMNSRVKTNIMIAYTKAQRLLQKWKQDIIFKEVDSFLSTIFPHSPLVKQMVETQGHVENVDKRDEISFKDLGITQVTIANKLMEHNLLPQNFFQLT